MSIGRHAALTDTGRKRHHNEDSYIVQPPLFAVADGMGGANAGEVASGLAVDALRGGANGAEIEQAIVQLVQAANRSVYDRATSDAGAAGMGTTMTLAVVGEGVVRFGHVGDSRAYLYRDGELKQLTDDHSLVGELVRSGKLSPDDAEKHPQRSVITRALGTDPDVDVDTYDVETKSGDLFILCSDGLYSMVGTDRILDLVDRNRGDLDALAKALVNAANRGGGDDNITVVAFEIAAPGDETVRLPAARPPVAEDQEPEPEPEPDEADTLDETDEVPVVPRAQSTMVIRPEDVAALSRPQAEPEPDEPPVEAPAGDSGIAEEPAREGGRRTSRILATLLIVAVIAALVAYLIYRLV